MYLKKKFFVSRHRVESSCYNNNSFLGYSEKVIFENIANFVSFERRIKLRTKNWLIFYNFTKIKWKKDKNNLDDYDL